MKWSRRTISLPVAAAMEAAATRPRLRAAVRRCEPPPATWPTAPADWPRPRHRRRRRAAGDAFESRGRDRRLRQVARPALGAAACGKEGLHDAVFQRVERDHHQTSARLEDPLRRGEPVGKLRQLVVDEQAKRLKRAGGRMDVARPAVDHARDDVGESARRRDRPLAARRHDGAGDGAGPALLAQQEDDVRELALRTLRDDVGRGRTGRAHAHVERPLEAEREAALGGVELHGGHAEVEHDAVHRFHPELARDAVERAQTRPAPASSGPRPLRSGVALRPPPAGRDRSRRPLYPRRRGSPPNSPPAPKVPSMWMPPSRGSRFSTTSRRSTGMWRAGSPGAGHPVLSRPARVSLPQSLTADGAGCRRRPAASIPGVAAPTPTQKRRRHCRPAALLHGQPHGIKKKLSRLGLASASACVNETKAPAGRQASV